MVKETWSAKIETTISKPFIAADNEFESSFNDCAEYEHNQLNK